MKLQRLPGEQGCATDTGNRRRAGLRHWRMRTGIGASFDFLMSDRKFLKIIEGSYDNRAGAVPNLDPQKWTAERRAEEARRWGREAKPPDLSAIMRRAQPSLGRASTFGSGDHGG